MDLSPAFTPRAHATNASDFTYNPFKLANTAWTGASKKAAKVAEEALLSKWVKSPYTLGKVSIDLPQLGLGVQKINTLDVNSDADGVPLVLTHGAGSGIAFFYKNIEALATLNGGRRRLLAFDWLGCALSSRPSYPYGGIGAKPTWLLTEEERVTAAIRFSVESLEAWRIAMRLERFDLAAHSMGGYLATQYALAHPERVRRLVLISPVGWARRPEGELADARAKGLFGALWESGLGNFGFAKNLGRIVQGVAQSAVLGRLNIRDEEERKLVASYFWNSLCGQPVSAERNINYLLVPYLPPAPFGFYARRPVCTEPPERLAKLPPTTLLYGSNDLHYIPTLSEAVKAVAAVSREPVRMDFVRRADHHLYIDNPEDFHAKVARAIDA